MEDLLQLNGNTRLKLKIKKRSGLSSHTLKARVNGRPLCPLSNISNGKSRPKDSGLSKRKNPFHCEKPGSKRIKQSKDDSDDKENDFSHFKITKNTKNSTICTSSYDDIFQHTDAEEEQFESNDGESNITNKEKKPDLENKGSSFPTDWSLKAKVKFTSEKQFNWCANLKSSQISQAVGNFVRCENRNNMADCCDDLGVEFRRNLLYWKHPCLPNIPSFPISEKNLAEAEHSPKFVNICKDSVMQTEIMKEWAHSFQSLFTLTKCGFCPYFYMCCQKFVFLFIGHGVLPDGMVAVVTPTTKGLRDLLTKEGIEFTMPHINKDSSTEEERVATQDDFEEDYEHDDHDDDFLSSLGLNKKNFSSIEQQSIVEELSKLSSIDNRPQSTVVVKNCHLNALFNFFVNSDIIVAQSGNWQGVPPTLLSPVAFEGATLKSLKCIQGPMKINGKDGMKQVYGLEISGTLLPSQLYNILHLAKDSNTSYEASVSTHTHTGAFNINQESQQEITQSDSTPKIGISEQCLKYLRRSSTLSNDGLASLRFSSNKFEWKTNMF